MRFTHGDVRGFKELHWYFLELRSEKTVEATLNRLMKAIPAIFGEVPIELFVPVASRDLGRFELTTLDRILVRSPNFKKLLRLKTVTGISGLGTSDDSNSPSKVMVLDHSYVKGLIADAEERFVARAENLNIGSFVRIIDGEERDWCGTITHLRDGVAIVRVELKTKVLTIETPVRNLTDLNHVPEHLRVFYYSSLIADMSQTLHHILAEDLVYQSEHQPEDTFQVAPTERRGRQQTVTAMVKRLVTTGVHDPMEIGRQVLAALKDGSIKRPKNLAIVHGVIKSHLIEGPFKSEGVKNYNDVIRLFGSQYRFSIRDLAKLDKDHFIPVNRKEALCQTT